MGVGTAIGNNC